MHLISLCITLTLAYVLYYWFNFYFYFYLAKATLTRIKLAICNKYTRKTDFGNTLPSEKVLPQAQKG